MYDFPNSPAVNQVFGNYTWDGEKWKQTSTAILPSSSTPLMDGTATAGSSVLYTRGDHVHLTDTTRAARGASQAIFRHGGALTGPLTGTTATMSGAVHGATLQADTTMVCNQAVFGEPAVADFLASRSSTSPDVRTLQFAAGYSLSQNMTAALLQYWANSAVAMTLDNLGSMILYGTGNLTIAGNGVKPGGGSWGSTSDARVKTVEAKYKHGINKISKHQPVIYKYKDNETPPNRKKKKKNAAEKSTKFAGLIAQEVEVIFPGMVTQGEGWIDGVKVDDMRTLDTTPLIFALVNCIKELKARVEALEAAPA
jgi:hypothetical protein